MLTFANRRELRKKAERMWAVQRHNMILVTHLFLSLQSRPDTNMSSMYVHFVSLQIRKGQLWDL